MIQHTNICSIPGKELCNNDMRLILLSHNSNTALWTVPLTINTQLSPLYNSPFSLNKIFDSLRYSESFPTCNYLTRRVSVDNSFPGPWSMSSRNNSRYSHCDYQIILVIKLYMCCKWRGCSQDTPYNNLLYAGLECFISWTIATQAYSINISQMTSMSSLDHSTRPHRSKDISQSLS